MITKARHFDASLLASLDQCHGAIYFNFIIVDNDGTHSGHSMISTFLALWGCDAAALNALNSAWPSVTWQAM
jgi:hypothetical protein